MASPLGLTDISKVQYTSDEGNPNDPNFSGGYKSLFNGTKFYHRPTVATEQRNETIKDQNGNTQTVQKQQGVAKGSKIHQSNSNDDIYDISTNSIIEYTNDPKLPAMALKPADFIYLKDFGVYPNNRLAISRRFPSPVENDLTAVGQKPLSTIVSWIPDDADEFFSFSASEQWSEHNTEDPLGEITDIFNNMFAKATNINVKKEGAGVLGGGMFKKFPVGGIAEALETTVTNYLLGNENSDGSFSNGTNFRYDNLPMGNPNFMGESAYRKMNSLRSSISIPIKCVYEMKYINGQDPTLVHMDIIQNILRFSSSQSVFYISQAGGSRINRFFNKFKDGDWYSAIGVIIEGIIEAVKEIFADIGRFFTNPVGNVVEGVKNLVDGDFQEAANQVKRQVESGLKIIGNSALARYRIEFSKVIPAATGSSSAPWHLTLGNPKNPFFSSGDMIVENTKIKMGNTLGFNDIPTQIEFSFTIKSARNLGIQEIFDKFNVGPGRQYQRNAISFKTDFYQGSVSKTGGGSSNPATGA
jgi:hypothetical protein